MNSAEYFILYSKRGHAKMILLFCPWKCKSHLADRFDTDHDDDFNTKSPEMKTQDGSLYTGTFRLKLSSREINVSVLSIPLIFCSSSCNTKRSWLISLQTISANIL